MTHKYEHTHNPKVEHIHGKGHKNLATKPKHGGLRSILFSPVGGMSNASTRLICYENAPYLRQLGWRVKVGRDDASKYGITIFQKRYSSRDLARAKATGGKTVLQISEARFVGRTKQSEDVIRFAKQVDKVVVGTRKTQDWFKAHGVTSTVIPTGLDFANLPHGVRKYKPIKICWIGNSRNEVYLNHLVEPLNRLWKEFDFEFRVIGGKMLAAAWMKQPNFIKWQLGEAEKYVAECHIGVAPLNLGSVELTKPPSKPVLYMALKLATIGTDTPPYRGLIQNGVNGFLISNNDPDAWYEALHGLFDDTTRTRIANAGYESCQSYNAPVIAKRWDKFLRGL